MGVQLRWWMLVKLLSFSFLFFFNEIRNKDIISASRMGEEGASTKQIIIFKQRICFFVEPKAIIFFVQLFSGVSMCHIVGFFF